METKLTHFCHPHQLTQIPTTTDTKPICAACVDPILSASLYTCADCNFHIHESCLHQMPQKVEHYFHWTHQLLPTPLLPYQVEKCDGCLGEIRGVTFRCTEDEYYNLHACCAQNPIRYLRHNCHWQILYYFPPKSCPRSAPCKVCGKNCNGSFFRSVWSEANFHLECIPLPKIDSFDCHQHPLKLVESFTTHRDSSSRGVNCFVCGVKCEENHSVYCCDECSSTDSFVAHIECVASDKSDFLHFSQGDGSMLVSSHGPGYNCKFCDFRRKSFLDMLAGEHEICNSHSEYSDLHSASLKDINGLKEGERYAIRHWLHEHELILSSSEKLGEKFLEQFRCRKCLGAVKGAVFACTECGFYLHQTCVNIILNEMLHPHHPLHPLRAKDSEDERCDGCKRIFTGIAFKCEECQFSLDVPCAYSTA